MKKKQTKLNLSGQSKRVKAVIRILCIDSVERLLAVKQIVKLKNCGPKTIEQFERFRKSYRRLAGQGGGRKAHR